MVVRLPREVPAETRRKLEAVLGSDITLLGKHWEFVGQCLGVIGNTQQAIDVADFALEFTRFVKTGTLVAKAAQFLSAADLILGPLGHILAITKAAVSGREAFAYTGTAYGMTAWAFDRPPPQPSPVRMKNLMLSKPQERGLWELAWRTGVNNVQRELQKLGQSGVNSKQTLQVVMRAMGENDPATLNFQIMKSMEPKLAAMGPAHLESWKYYNERHYYPQ